MGKEVSEEEPKEAWDSNAITPGTPFMDLLTSSLRYWIVHKINTDPGWKNVGQTNSLQPWMLTCYRFKYYCQTLACQERVNTRLWILYDDSELIQDTTPTLDM
jgi:hypothetical protein